MGRFARRVKAWATTNGVPVTYCKAGECKHLIAEEHLAAHPAAPATTTSQAEAAPTIAALPTLRDQVIAPSSPASAAPPRTQTHTLDPDDRDYEALRIGMQDLFHDLGITPIAACPPVMGL